MRRAVFAIALLAAAPLARAEPAPLRLSLAAATERGLATHEKVAAAAAEQRRAAIGEWTAWSAVAPSLEASGSYTRNENEITFPEDLAAAGGLDPLILQEKALRGALTVTQPIVSPQFFALRDLGRAASAGAGEAFRGARLDVAFAVGEAYYGVLRAQSLLEVAKESLALADLEAEHARTRFGEGDAVRSDVLRAETEVERARQRVLDAEGVLAAARRRLGRLLAIADPIEVEEPPEPTVDLASEEAFVAAAREQNPEIRQAARALEAARAEADRRRAVLYPTLGVRFQYRLLDEETFAERSNWWEAVAGVQVPLIPSGGAPWIAWREQKARVDKAEVELRGLEHDVELGVREAFIAARTLTEREVVAEKEESLAEEGHRILSEGYREGVATSVDLLAALNARSAAKAGRAALRYDRRVALLRLERAAGLLGDR